MRFIRQATRRATGVNPPDAGLTDKTGWTKPRPAVYGDWMLHERVAPTNSATWADSGNIVGIMK